MKAICGFQNADGGLLYIGITDTGDICGIEKDYEFLSYGTDTASYNKNADGFENKIRNSVNFYLGKASLDKIRLKFYRHQPTRHLFCIVFIDKTPRPIYVQGKEAFKRFGNSSRSLKGDEITDLAYAKLNDDKPQTIFTTPMPDDCMELNPNQDVKPPVSTIVKLDKEAYNKMDFYYMSFYSSGEFLYSKNSHANDSDIISEIRFNRYNGNLEYSRDLLVKCTGEGSVQFIAAFEMCKLCAPDVRCSIADQSLESLIVKVAHKYDFLKVVFTDGHDDFEKYIRVQSMFGKNTEEKLKSNKYDVKKEFKLKGNSIIPNNMTLKSLEVIHETLPDEIRFVSAKAGSDGKGSKVGSQIIDPATY